MPARAISDNKGSIMSATHSASCTAVTVAASGIFTALHNESDSAVRRHLNTVLGALATASNDAHAGCDHR